MNPGLQLQRNPELPAGWVAFPLASGIGSAYNPVRDSIAAPGTSLGQPSFPLALGYPTAVLGPPALQKADCLPRDRYPARNRIQGQRFAPRQAPRPRVLFAPVLGVGAAHRHAPPHSGQGWVLRPQSAGRWTLTRKCLQRQRGRRCTETLLLKTN